MRDWSVTHHLEWLIAHFRSPNTRPANETVLSLKPADRATGGGAPARQPREACPHTFHADQLAVPPVRHHHTRRGGRVPDVIRRSSARSVVDGSSLPTRRRRRLPGLSRTYPRMDRVAEGFARSLGDVAGDAVSNLDLSDGISPGSLATARAIQRRSQWRWSGGAVARISRGVRRAARRVGLTSVWISMSSGRCSGAACALGDCGSGVCDFRGARPLAEVALDAAIVSTLYRRLHKHDRSHWAIAVLGRTWVPALLLAMFAAIGGYALERATPDAESIGDVVRAVWGH